MHQRKKKICLVVSSTSIVNEFLINHIKGLSLLYDIHLVVNAKSGSPVESTHIIDVFNLPIERRPHLIKDFLCLFPLYKYFKENKFDIIHSVTPKGGLLGMFCGFLVRAPIRIHIFTGQVWHTQNGIIKTVLKLFDLIIAKLTTHILVDGISQQHFLIDHGIITLENSKVLGKGSISGVNKSDFMLKHETRNFYRTQYKIGNDEIVFAYMGRLNRDKGILDLVNAFQALNNIYSNTKLVLIGMDEENLVPLIQNKFSCDKILFIQYTREPFNALQLADIFCFPSYREGFGMSVIEASMLELPVICSDTYGLNETIIPKVTGLKYRVGDIVDLKNQMESLLNNPSLCKLMGQKGKEYVSDNFDSEQMTNLWIDFYKSLQN